MADLLTDVANTVEDTAGGAALTLKDGVTQLAGTVAVLAGAVAQLFPQAHPQTAQLHAAADTANAVAAGLK